MPGLTVHLGSQLGQGVRNGPLGSTRCRVAALNLKDGAEVRLLLPRSVTTTSPRDADPHDPCLAASEVRVGGDCVRATGLAIFLSGSVASATATSTTGLIVAAV